TTWIIILTGICIHGDFQLITQYLLLAKKVTKVTDISVNSKQLAVNTNTTYDLLKGNKSNTFSTYYFLPSL
ncbi:hypothetical protein, partial [Dysgonomonas sp. UBA7710]|uniref:hypothetical protein n=1 Tax=Dysgonomonas sp. UBA7710 TaxID=1946428 RepID=UPI0025BCF573